MVTVISTSYLNPGTSLKVKLRYNVATRYFNSSNAIRLPMLQFLLVRKNRVMYHTKFFDHHQMGDRMLQCVILHYRDPNVKDRMYAQKATSARHNVA